jgi:DNA-binding PadR family transcriptional regulator
VAATENNRRAKYYLLTDGGRKALKDETREWGRQIAAIARILESLTLAHRVVRPVVPRGRFPGREGRDAI